MKEMERKRRRWPLLIAAAVLAAVCVAVYRSDGLGGAIPDLPGGFTLCVSVLERDGSVARYDLSDAAQISAVQHCIHAQKAERLRDRAGLAPDYPFLSFSDGEGQNARRAVYAGGAWVDSAGRTYALALDPAELLALLPETARRTGPADFPCRMLAASMTGAWDTRLLEPATATPEHDVLQLRARERSGDRLSVTVYNPGGSPVICRPEIHLQVALDGTWYAVPPLDGAQPETGEIALEPESSALFTASVEETERRYGKLPAGHYRIVLLSYDEEFDIA